jgi:hypothetical protein
MRSRYAILVAGLLFLVWFLIFGGEVIQPVIDGVSEKARWQNYLKACQPDELRVHQYLDGEERQAGMLNLTTGVLTGEGAPMVIRYGPVWTEVKLIFHTINFPMQARPYDPATLTQIKSFLATLPGSTSCSALDSYRTQFHIAFYQNGQLRLYDYRKDEAKTALAPLFTLLGFNLID